MWKTYLPISPEKEMKKKIGLGLLEADSLVNEPDMDFWCNLVHWFNKSRESYKRGSPCSISRYSAAKNTAI